MRLWREGLAVVQGRGGLMRGAGLSRTWGYSVGCDRLCDPSGVGFSGGCPGVFDPRLLSVTASKLLGSHLGFGCVDR